MQKATRSCNNIQVIFNPPEECLAGTRPKPMKDYGVLGLYANLKGAVSLHEQDRFNNYVYDDIIGGALYTDGQLEALLYQEPVIFCVEYFAKFYRNLINCAYQHHKEIQSLAG